MKAIGISGKTIYLYHALRFLFIGMISVMISEIFAIPLTHLCIDSLFKMMGLETGVDYVINPMETFITFPAIVFITTMICAYLTSMYIRKINPQIYQLLNKKGADYEYFRSKKSL